jgi:hypothetical protein
VLLTVVVAEAAVETTTEMAVQAVVELSVLDIEQHKW